VSIGRRVDSAPTPTHAFSAALPTETSRTVRAVALDWRRPLDDLAASGALDQCNLHPLAGTCGTGERDLRRYRASRIQYTAGSGPHPAPYDRFVNAGALDAPAL
jgi:hypothetical protein